MVSGFSVGVGVGVAVAVGVAVGGVVTVGKVVFVGAGGAVAITCAMFATGPGGLLHPVITVANKIATNSRKVSFMVISSMQNGPADSAPSVPHLASRA